MTGQTPSCRMLSYCGGCCYHRMAPFRGGPFWANLSGASAASHTSLSLQRVTPHHSTHTHACKPCALDLYHLFVAHHFTSEPQRHGTLCSCGTHSLLMSVKVYDLVLLCICAGLSQVLLTGGLPPYISTADAAPDSYRRLFRRVIRQNERCGKPAA